YKQWRKGNILALHGKGKRHVMSAKVETPGIFFIWCSPDRNEIIFVTPLQFLDYSPVHYKTKNIVELHDAGNFQLSLRTQDGREHVVKSNTTFVGNIAIANAFAWNHTDGKVRPLVSQRVVEFVLCLLELICVERL